MSKAVNTILFDLGNVLINFDHRIAAKKIAPFTGKTPQEIYSLFFDSNITQFFEAGKITPQDFFLDVKKMAGLNLDYEHFVPIWNEIFFLTDENRGVYKLAQGLKSDYNTAMLSNINILHFEYLKKNFPLFDAFRRVFVSYELGYIKPDPLIYKKVLQQLGKKPSEVFYVDDRPELVEKAGELGIRAFVYKGTEQLKNDLATCGVIIGTPF